MRKKKEMRSRAPELNLTLCDSSAEHVLELLDQALIIVKCTFRKDVAVY